MNRVKGSYLKIAAVVAVVAVSAMTLITPMRGSTAKNETVPPASAVGADLLNEYQVLVRYSNDLAAYDTQVAEAGKRARLVSADFDPLQRKSDDLKGRLSQVQSTMREIIRKLKDAGEWNNLDTLPARITDPGLKALFKESSLQQDLDEAANGLTGRANEISTPLDNLRKRLTSRYDFGRDVQFVPASYAPAPYKFVSVRCSILVVKTKIIIKLPSVNPSSQHARETWEACHPGQAYPF